MIHSKYFVSRKIHLQIRFKRKKFSLFSLAKDKTAFCTKLAVVALQTKQLWRHPMNYVTQRITSLCFHFRNSLMFPVEVGISVTQTSLVSFDFFPHSILVTLKVKFDVNFICLWSSLSLQAGCGKSSLSFWLNFALMVWNDPQ